jgi:hypothetical protein
MLGTRKVVTYDGDKYYEESWLSIVRWDVQPALAAVLPTIFVERLSFAVRAPADFVSSWLGHLPNASPDFTATVNALTSDFVSDGSQLAV